MHRSAICPACSAANTPDTGLCAACGRPLEPKAERLTSTVRHPKQSASPPEVPEQPATGAGFKNHNDDPGRAAAPHGAAAARPVKKPWWDLEELQPPAKPATAQHLPVFKITMMIWSALFLIWVIYSVLD